MSSEPVFLNVYGTPKSIPRNKFRQPICSLAGRYDNLLPPRFLAPIDSLKISALSYSSTKWIPARVLYCHFIHHRGCRLEGRLWSASCTPYQLERAGGHALFGYESLQEQAAELRATANFSCWSIGHCSEKIDDHTVHLIIYSSVLQLTDETIALAAAVHNNWHNIGLCFHLCDGLNCGTHYVTGMGTLCVF